MRVLYVNTYFQGGGAEKVVRQLFYGMQKERIETFYLVGRWQKNIPDDVSVIYSDLLERSITTLAGNILNNTLLKTVHAKREIIRIIREKNIDIVHFHNMHGNYLGIFDLQEIKKFCKKIVITMHDMWLITGCCFHAMECQEWHMSSCKRCYGNIILKNGKKYAGKLLTYKEINFSGQGIYFVTPSKWLKNCCQQGYLLHEDVRVINNGIDVVQYRVWNKREIRKKYHLPENKRIILFSANGIDNPYKGFRYLKKALEMVPEKEKYILLIVGNKNKEKIDLPYDVYDMGYVKDFHIMNEIYSAADLFILPSMADVFPFTMLEAMASGTPVLAFATGGIPEAVSEEVGWLVPKGNSSVLATRIRDIFADVDILKAKTEKCHLYIEEKFSENIMIRNYKKLYEEITGSRV